MNGKSGSAARLAAGMLLLSGVIVSCGSERSAETTAPETIGDVVVATAKRSEVSDRVEAIGTVRAAQTSQIASQIMGSVNEVQVREGDRVAAGQVLALIADTESRAAVAKAAAAAVAAQKELSAAETQLTLADSTLRRYQQLYEKRSVSPQEFDEIKARYQTAQAARESARAAQDQADAALTQARTTLSYTRIRAPFAGMITKKMADAGTLASPGVLLFTIEDTRRFRLEAALDERDMHLARIGEEVAVALDALGSRALPGKVVQVVPAADAASRTFLVKIDLPRDDRLRSGLFGRARFSRGMRPALLIPQSAVLERGQLREAVVVGEQNFAHLRYVTLGPVYGTDVEVLSGLQEGERFVAAPGARELEGKKIASRP